MGKKLSYLEGYIKGLHLDSSSAYARALKEITRCLASMDEDIDDLKDKTEELYDKIEDIDDVIDDINSYSCDHNCSCGCHDSSENNEHFDCSDGVCFPENKKNKDCCQCCDDSCGNSTSDVQYEQDYDCEDCSLSNDSDEDQ